MPSPINRERLLTKAWEQVQDRADQLAKAWTNGTPLDLNLFLDPPGSPLRLEQLHELIKTDIELAWRHGYGHKLEEYARQFPELGPAGMLDARLIYEEYRVRQVHGDKPPLAVYQNRFPSRFEELRQLIEREPIKVAAAAPKLRMDLPGMGSPHLPFGGGYTLVQLLGSGTFADVYRAEAPGGVAVAIKAIRKPLEHHEAQQELQSLEKTKNLRHPFLVKIHAFYVHDGRLYIVMDLADGTLLDRLKECPAGIPVPELLRYFREAAEALDYLRDQDLLHRDVKPANILLVKSRGPSDAARPRTSSLVQAHAKLADFGLAKLLESQRMTASHAGTPAYWPPEVWQGKVSIHTDQFSLAATYVELRRGKPLFCNTSLPELMKDVIARDPDLSPLSAAEQRVLSKALAKEPEDRFNSCQEFIEELDAALRPVQPTPAQPSGQSSYRQLHRLPSSSRGEVWEALAPDQTSVALTVIRNVPAAEAREDFKTFNFIRQHLQHVHLARLRQVLLVDSKGGAIPDGAAQFTGKASLYLDCELHTGDFGQLLEKSRRHASKGLPARELLAAMRQAAGALDYLNGPHPVGNKQLFVRHCGVTPESLLLFDDQVKLGDFSHTRLVDSRRAPINNSNLEPGWAAPEMFLRDPVVTDRSDQFSLAVTYYRLRTGELPFAKYDKLELAEGKLDLSKAPSAERAVLARATSVNPDDRFQNCSEMVRALEAASVTPEATPQPLATTPPPAPGGVARPDSKGAGLGSPFAPPSSGDSLPTLQASRFGSYQILDRLGEGGMGIVYQAEDARLRRLVALKVMHRELTNQPQARERFLREARAMAAVRSDHVVTIYEVDQVDNVPYLAMELLYGQTLDAWLKSGGQASVGEIVRIGREIVAGLAAAHERGLIHRDIKPANLWLERASAASRPSHPGQGAPLTQLPGTGEGLGRIKILDFGLARPTDNRADLTRTGDVVGTPHFMAPEQARGKDIDGRSDLFSLGVVLYRLCTGQLPFQGSGVFAVLAALVEDLPEPVCQRNPSIPAPLGELVMQLLEKDPARRPASAADVLVALQALETQNLSSRSSRPSSVENIPSISRSMLEKDFPASLAPGASLPGLPATPGEDFEIPLDVTTTTRPETFETIRSDEAKRKLEEAKPVPPKKEITSAPSTPSAPARPSSTVVSVPPVPPPTAAGTTSTATVSPQEDVVVKAKKAEIDREAAREARRRAVARVKRVVRKLAKVAVVVGLLGGVLGAGWFWGVPAVMQARVNSAIESKEFETAFSRIESAKRLGIPASRIELWHSRNRSAWLAEAREKADSKYYKAADDVLTAYLSSYEDDADAATLKETVHLRVERLIEKLMTIHQAAGSDQHWQSVFAETRALEKEFPDPETEAKAAELCAAAIATATKVHDRQLSSASNAKSPDESRKHFHDALDTSQQIARYAEQTGKNREALTWQRWLEYGRKLLPGNPRSAQLVAKAMLDKNPNAQGAKELQQQASAGISGLEASERVQRLINEFKTSLNQGDPTVTHKLVIQIKQDSVNLGNKDQESLAEACKGLPSMVDRVGNNNSKETVLLELVKELQGLQLPEADFYLRCTTALVHLHAKKYTSFLDELNIEKHWTQHPSEILNAIQRATQTCLGDPHLRESNPETVLERLRPILKASHAPTPEGAQALGELYRTLLDAYLSRALNALKTANDYRALRPLLEVVEVSHNHPLIGYCLAECYLFQENTYPNVSQPSQDHALRAIASAATPVDAAIAYRPPKGYAQFVQGLLDRSGFAVDKAAEEFREAFKSSEAWRSGELRKHWAADCLCVVAARKATENDKAVGLYRDAENIGGPLQLDYHRDFARRAFEIKDYKLYEQTTNDLLEHNFEGLGDEVLELMVRNAESRRQTGKNDKALARYEEIIHLRDQQQTPFKDFPSAQFYAKVVKPAIDIGQELVKQADSSLNKGRLAKVYFTKGKLLLFSSRSDRLPPEEVDSFEASIRYHPLEDETKSLYHAWLGFALGIRRSPGDLPRMRESVQAAQKYPDSMMTQAVKGYYHDLRAELDDSDVTEAVADWVKAASTYEKVIELAKPLNDMTFLAFFYKRLSRAYVLLADKRRDKSGSRDVTKAKEDLRKAQLAGEKARQCAPADPDAYGLLGNAWEDLSWSVYGGDTANYKNAEETFQKEIELYPARADGYVNLGRCYFKWGEDVRAENGKMKQAVRWLKDALRMDPSHPEGNYWMGRVLWKGKNHAEALVHFASAVNDRASGDKWRDSLKAMTLLDQADWRDLCRCLLPSAENAVSTEKRAWALRQRCIISLDLPGFAKTDLLSPNPQLIADADDAARYEPDRKARAGNLNLAARLRGRAVIYLREQKSDGWEDQSIKYRSAMAEKLADMFASDPEIGFPEGPDDLIKYAGFLAVDAKAGRTELFNKAIQLVDVAIRRSKDDAKIRRYKEYREELDRELR